MLPVTIFKQPLKLACRYNPISLFETTKSPICSSSILRQANDEQLRVFRENATKWWTGKEFSILRSMNELRVPFIVDGLAKPINETKILDVGCGGGILSEPLARLGANVLGIDPVFESINQAQLHAEQDPDLTERLKYRNCNIEDLSSQGEHVGSYDALVASEVLEHIEDIEHFLKHCTKIIKPNGSLFITTINQTPLSWLGVIFFGEYILKQLPKGTHTYDMFVSVKGLRVMLERLGYHVKLINGFMYEPVSGNFYWTPTTLTHYAIQAVKIKPLAKNINYQQKRHKPQPAKKPKRPLDDSEMMVVIPIDIFRDRIKSIITDFKDHIETKLATRTTVASLERLLVTIEGLNEPLELRDIAQLSMKGSNLLVVNMSTMPEAVKPTLNALKELGNLMPQIEVNNIYIPLPRITHEHREKVALLAKKKASDSKAELNRLFTEYSSRARNRKAKGGLSDDLIYNTVENLQYLTKQSAADIDKMLQTKTDQLLKQSH